MMNTKLIIPLLLQLLGVAVIIAEFLIPSAGLLSIVAVGLLGYSLFAVFTDVSTGAGFIILAADVVTLPILVIIGLKLIGRSKATLHQTLSSADGVSSQPEQLEHYIGMDGVTVSLLRPAGIALINGKRLDVVSKGEYINKGKPVSVVAVTGNQVVVRLKEISDNPTSR
jgi:membrane-bound ClpP family serine protease